MKRSFEFSLDGLPLVMEAGFAACELVEGMAEISYTADGEWNIEEIYFDGCQKLSHSMEDQRRALLNQVTLPYWDRKKVALDAGTPIHAIIYHRLENEWMRKVYSAVQDEIENDLSSREDNRADARRDAMMARD